MTLTIYNQVAEDYIVEFFDRARSEQLPELYFDPLALLLKISPLGEKFQQNKPDDFDSLEVDDGIAGWLEYTIPNFFFPLPQERKKYLIKDLKILADTYPKNSEINLVFSKITKFLEKNCSDIYASFRS